MRHKILISMAIATLFAMSACSDDDSSSTPNNPPAPPVTDPVQKKLTHFLQGFC